MGVYQCGEDECDYRTPDILSLLVHLKVVHGLLITYNKRKDRYATISCISSTAAKDEEPQQQQQEQLLVVAAGGDGTVAEVKEPQQQHVTCPICNKILQRKQSLKNHISYQHLQCEYCNYVAARGHRDLVKHLKSIHGHGHGHDDEEIDNNASSSSSTPTLSPLSPTSFSKGSQKTTTSQTRKLFFQCDRCSYTNTRKNNVTKHVKGVHDKMRQKRKCDLCPFFTYNHYSLLRHKNNYCHVLESESESENETDMKMENNESQLIETNEIAGGETENNDTQELDRDRDMDMDMEIERLILANFSNINTIIPIDNDNVSNDNNNSRKNRKNQGNDDEEEEEHQSYHPQELQDELSAVVALFQQELPSQSRSGHDRTTTAKGQKKRNLEKKATAAAAVKEDKEQEQRQLDRVMSFPCPMCHMKLRNKYNLKYHMSHCHVSCHQCDYVATTGKRDMKKHVNFVHGNDNDTSSSSSSLSLFPHHSSPPSPLRKCQDKKNNKKSQKQKKMNNNKNQKPMKQTQKEKIPKIFQCDRCFYSHAKSTMVNRHVRFVHYETTHAESLYKIKNECHDRRENKNEVRQELDMENTNENENESGSESVMVKMDMEENEEMGMDLDKENTNENENESGGMMIIKMEEVEFNDNDD